MQRQPVDMVNAIKEVFISRLTEASADEEQPPKRPEQPLVLDEGVQTDEAETVRIVQDNGMLSKDVMGNWTCAI